MGNKEFTFANGRLTAIGTSKSSVRVYISVGEHVGMGFISIKNFLYMLNNPNADYEIEAVHECVRMKRLANGDQIQVHYPSTFWICPLVPSRF